MATRAFQRAIGEVRMLPYNSHKKCLKELICRLLITFKLFRIKYAIKLLCVKTCGGYIVVELFPYLMVYRRWR